MAFARNARLDSGPCGPVPPPRAGLGQTKGFTSPSEKHSYTRILSEKDDIHMDKKVSKATNDALRTEIQSSLDDVNALIDLHEGSVQVVSIEPSLLGHFNGECKSKVFLTKNLPLMIRARLWKR